MGGGIIFILQDDYVRFELNCVVGPIVFLVIGLLLDHLRAQTRKTWFSA